MCCRDHDFSAAALLKETHSSLTLRVAACAAALGSARVSVWEMLEDSERFKGVHKKSHMREIIELEWAQRRALQRLND